MALPVGARERIPLENGDRLTREQFHARYSEWPEIKKAEYIDGVVYVASPVRNEHAEAHASTLGWLLTFAANHPDLQLLGNATVILEDNERLHEVQPDALLRRRGGGSSTTIPGGYISGPPELIVEIGASSASYDLHDKLRLYMRSGVREYIVWTVYDRRLHWFELTNSEYVEREIPGEDAETPGILESSQFPGLRLDIPALLAGDLATVLATLRLPPEDRPSSGGVIFTIG